MSNIASLRFGLLLFAIASSAVAEVAVGQPALPAYRDSLPPPAENIGRPPVPDSSIPVEITVAEVRIVGNRGIPSSRVLRHLTTRAGRPFDRDLVQSDVRKIFHLGWFSHVEPLYDDSPAGRIVIFKVTVRPTIRYIQFLGAEKIKAKTLEKQISFKRGDTIDPYRVEESRHKIEDFYKEKGFNRVQVTIAEGSSVKDQGIVYVINEGVAQKIWSVVFEGNQFVSDRRLKTQIASKPGFAKYFFGGKVDPEKIAADEQRLTAYYRAFGFFQAKVRALKEFNEKGNWLTLRFIIHEGPRYHVRRVSFVGNKRFASEDLQKTLRLLAGQPYDQLKMNRDRTWLQELYGSQGCVFADIRADMRFDEKPGQLDLVYHIEEGKQWRVGRIFVHIDGPNPHTRVQTALDRITLRPGDIMDIREIKASERRLQASRLFRYEPARGVAPKIAYRIPELQDQVLANRPRSRFRGQSPEADASPKPSRRHTYRPTPGTDVVDLHVFAQPADDDTDQNETPDSTPKRHTVRKPPFPNSQSVRPRKTERPILPAYRNLFPGDRENSTRSLSQERPTYENARTIIRGQNPTYPSTPYRAAAASAYPPPSDNRYDGQAVGATGPDSNRTVGPPARQPATRVAQNSTAQPAFDPVVPLSPSRPQTYPQPNPPWQLFPQSPQVPGAFDDPMVDLYVDLEETETGRFMAGASVNSDLGVFGNFVIEEQNFDWRRFPRSWEDVRNGTAWRGDGQRFRLEAAPGSQVQRYLISLQQPYLWHTPVSLGVSGSFYDRRFVDWDEQRVGGRVSFGYQWTQRDVATTFAYRGEKVNIRNPALPTPTQLAEVIGNNELHGLQVAITNDTRDNAFLATSGHFIRTSFEQVLGTFDYPRAILDMRQYFLLHERPDRSGRHVLSYSTRLGYTGTQTPIYEHFFAGGTSTLRGFDFRGASPIDPDFGVVRVGGEFMWINTLEYLYPISADDMIRGVVFCDFGTVEPSVEINDFRVAPGLGLRIVVPAMGPAPIALDFAWPILDAARDDREVFSFTVGFQRQ